MPRYVIERTFPGAGALGERDLKALAQRSMRVLADLAPQVQWLHSYVTADKIYCVYIAANEALIREHARRGEFPADSVAAIVTTIDPATAE